MVRCILPQLINFIAILGVFVTEMATDVYLPAVNCMMRDLLTSRQILNMTLSSNMVGLALSAPIYGALSDSFGRRKILMWGLFVFTVGSFLCAMAQSGLQLVVFRLVQGIGAGVSYGVGVAIQKDIFEGTDFAKARATMSLVLGFAPAIAPVMGGYMAYFMSWNMIFVITALLGLFTLFLVYTCVPETFPALHWKPFGWNEMQREYRSILNYRPFRVYAGLAGLFGSIYWGFISGMTFLFLQQLRVKEIEYPYYQLFLIAAFIIGTLVNRWMAQGYNADRMLDRAMALSLMFALLYMGVTWIYPDHPIILVIFMMPICVAMGVIFPNLGLRVMEVYPHSRGYVAAAYGSIELMMPAVGIQVMGWVYNGTALSITSCMVALHLLALYIWNLHQKTEQRYQHEASQES